MTQRSTNIGLMVKHCPMALDYAEQGVPYSRDVFHVGTAAHDILHAIGMAGGSLGVVPKVVEHLIGQGRGGVDAEGPLPADAVFEGRDLAVAYASEQEWSKEETWFELGIGLADDMRTIVSYTSDDAVFSSRPDMARIVPYIDEDDEYRLLEVIDYKTSWAAGEGELTTFQRRSQALAVRRWWESKGNRADGVMVAVVNLRTHARYSRIIWWASEEWEAIEQDVRSAVAAASHRPRVKSPGAGCLGCPFLTHCDPELPAPVASRFAVLSALKDKAQDEVRELLVDKEDRIGVPGGSVGWHRYHQQVVRADAAERLWNEVAADRVPKDSLAWELAVAMLKSTLTSKSAVEKAARFALPDGRNKLVMARRKMIIDACLDTKPSVRFGIQKEGK